MRPYDVKSADDILRMESDNFPGDPDKWSIMNSEDHVSLHPPADDSGKAWWVQIPRDQFNAIVDWYMRDQSTKADEREHAEP